MAQAAAKMFPGDADIEVQSECRRLPRLDALRNFEARPDKLPSQMGSGARALLMVREWLPKSPSVPAGRGQWTDWTATSVDAARKRWPDPEPALPKPPLTIEERLERIEAALRLRGTLPPE